MNLNSPASSRMKEGPSLMQKIFFFFFWKQGTKEWSNTERVGERKIILRPIRDIRFMQSNKSFAFISKTVPCDYSISMASGFTFRVFHWFTFSFVERSKSSIQTAEFVAETSEICTNGAFNFTFDLFTVTSKSLQRTCTIYPANTCRYLYLASLYKFKLVDWFLRASFWGKRKWRRLLPSVFSQT